MMHLRVDLEERLTQEFEEFEEERKMPFERVGQARMVLSLLAEVCGRVPEEYESRIRELQSEDLQKLAKALLRFRSLADLQSWLQQHSPTHA
jgi:hypothetical protein